MIVITERDQSIKSFLEEVSVADTKTIHTLFFTNTSLRNAQKRLHELTSIRFIKVYRENVISQNIYYSKNKCKNIAHKIVFSQLLAKLKRQNIEVLKYRTPFIIDNVIADGLIVIKVNNQVKIYFVEIERTKKLNISKYEELYYSRKYLEKFPVFPNILVITDKKQDTDHNVLNIVTCKLDLSNLRLD